MERVEVADLGSSLGGRGGGWGDGSGQGFKGQRVGRASESWSL